MILGDKYVKDVWIQYLEGELWVWPGSWFFRLNGCFSGVWLKTRVDSVVGGFKGEEDATLMDVEVSLPQASMADGFKGEDATLTDGKVLEAWSWAIVSQRRVWSLFWRGTFFKNISKEARSNRFNLYKESKPTKRIFEQ